MDVIAVVTRDEYGNIVGIWCKQLQVFDTDVTKSRALSISIAQALKEIANQSLIF